MLTAASGNMDTALVFAILVTISVAAMLLYMVVEVVETLAVPWHASIRNRDGGQH